MPSEVPTSPLPSGAACARTVRKKLTIFGEPAAFAVPDYKTVPSQASVFFRRGGKGVFAKLADSFLFHMLTPYPASRKRLRRLQKMRQYLSGQSHHNARRQAGY